MVRRITLNDTFRWALGDDPYVLEETEGWFRVVLTDTVPRESRPVTFTPAQPQPLGVPVLLVIGTRDALTGDPQAVTSIGLHRPPIACAAAWFSASLSGIAHPG